MRLQLSFEFLIYALVSGASLALTLGMYARSQSAGSIGGAGTYAEELVASINANMAYRTSSFSAYLPKGLCNATADGYTLATGLGSFALADPMEIMGNALCQSQGGIAGFNLTEAYNGTYLLYRVSG